MKRPYVVCHMLTSLDGKIDGAYMGAPQCLPALKEYGNLRSFYHCDATLYGTTTMEGSYSAALAPADLPISPRYPRTDYRAETDVMNYIVSLDLEGKLGWESQYIEKKNRPKAHVIEVLSEQVSDEYITYLRQYDISYVFAGKKELDCELLLHKLNEQFGIERLMIAGGGYTNWSFLQANCIDELSLVIAPVADGNTESVSIFEKAEFLPISAPIAFTLTEVKIMDGDSIWLRYQRQG